MTLRQTQGFIDSLFSMLGVTVRCPDYRCLLKRLAGLAITTPSYKKSREKKSTPIHDDAVAVAIDATGLKRFGRGEWQQEKYKIEGKRSWRKLHVAVDDNHIIQAAELTTKEIADCNAVEGLCEQLDIDVSDVMADGAYDNDHVYETISTHSVNANIIIPPVSTLTYKSANHRLRNQNLQQIKTFGRMAWQRVNHYGFRNYSELAIGRYKTIIGAALSARELSRQKIEALLGCGVLNKMTHLGMPVSYRCA